VRYLLVDRITLWEPPRRARGRKCVALSDDVFADHFPGAPIWPGAMILESLAQLGGALCDEAAHAAGRVDALSLLAVVHRAKFRRAVRAGDVIELDVEVLALDDDRVSLRGSATVDGEVAADAELGFVYAPNCDPDLVAARRRQLDIWRGAATRGV
jgi:3-hydroxyacyl-[acyl-carrier-protein] dehydratase